MKQIPLLCDNCEAYYSLTQLRALMSNLHSELKHADNPKFKLGASAALSMFAAQLANLPSITKTALVESGTQDPLTEDLKITVSEAASKSPLVYDSTNKNLGKEIAEYLNSAARLQGAHTILRAVGVKYNYGTKRYTIKLMSNDNKQYSMLLNDAVTLQNKAVDSAQKS